jgi:hypothetical protein
MRIIPTYRYIHDPRTKLGEARVVGAKHPVEGLLYLVHRLGPNPPVLVLGPLLPGEPTGLDKLLLVRHAGLGRGTASAVIQTSLIRRNFSRGYTLNGPSSKANIESICYKNDVWLGRKAHI